MKIVGYINSTTGSIAACNTQHAMIVRYCDYKKITCDRFYCDISENRRNKINVENMCALGYPHAYRLEKYFPQYDQMLYDITRGTISTILVDTIGRLAANKEQSKFFQKLCVNYNVEVIEVCGYLEGLKQDSIRNVAIYHITNQAKERPRIYTKCIDGLYEVSQLKGWGTPFLFQDFSLLKSEQIKYQEFKKHIDEYDILVVTDFYHIEDKLSRFISEIQSLEANGVAVESVKEGKIKHISDDFLKQELKVAIYDRWLDKADEGLELERLKAFVKYKTNWKITGIYKESEKVETDLKQQELQRLLRESHKYDALLVRKFNCFHWRTSMFFKVAKKLNIPIYSMKEGGIYLEVSGI